MTAFRREHARRRLPESRENPSGRRGPELALAGVAVVFGLTFVVVQHAVERMPVAAFLGYRFLPAAILVALLYREGLRRLPAAGWRAGAVMGALLTAGYWLQTVGLQHTSASNAGFITGLFVVLTPVLGALLLGQRTAAATWACAGLSALGLLLLSGTSGALRLEGDGLVLLCAFAFAGHILATGRGASRFEPGPLVAIQLAVCGLFSLAVAPFAGGYPAPPDGGTWFAIAFTSVACSALAYVVQTWAQRRAAPARAAIILACEPAFAAVGGYLLADDRLTAIGWTGAALMFGAILAVEAMPRRAPSPAPAGSTAEVRAEGLEPPRLAATRT